MTDSKIQKLRSLLGPKKFASVIREFPNERMPGTKAMNRLKRSQFLQNFDGKNIDKWARELGVSKQTLYNWLHQGSEASQSE